MLRIITWSKGYKPSRTTLDEMHWDLLRGMEPGDRHPEDYLKAAEHIVKVQAKYPDELEIVETINEIFFDALRVALKQNWVPNQVWCYIGESEPVETSVDHDGRMDYWPPVFNVYGEMLLKLL